MVFKWRFADVEIINNEETLVEEEDIIIQDEFNEQDGVKKTELFEKKIKIGPQISKNSNFRIRR